MHRFGGKVLDADGAPLHDVWITLPELGLFASSDPQGRFILQRVPTGTHKLIARSRDGNRGDGGDRRARSRPRPHRRARKARGEEEGGLTEWASCAARTAALAPLAHGTPDRRCWVTMPNDDSGRPRVLLGNLEPMVRLGMIDVLQEDGVEVIGEEERAQALVLMAGRLRPDAVVLDLLQRSSRELGERVRTASPETKVILWARDEDAMEVLDPGATTPRRFFTAVPEELRSELSNVRLNRVEE